MNFKFAVCQTVHLEGKNYIIIYNSTIGKVHNLTFCKVNIDLRMSKLSEIICRIVETLLLHTGMITRFTKCFTNFTLIIH